MMETIGTVQRLLLSAELKEELLPYILFFGMFFLVFGMGGILIRHIPRKPGSMLDEILNEDWDSDEEEIQEDTQNTSTETQEQPLLPENDEQTESRG